MSKYLPYIEIALGAILLITIVYLDIQSQKKQDIMNKILEEIRDKKSI